MILNVLLSPHNSTQNGSFTILKNHCAENAWAYSLKLCRPKLIACNEWVQLHPYTNYYYFALRCTVVTFCTDKTEWSAIIMLVGVSNSGLYFIRTFLLTVDFGIFCMPIRDVVQLTTRLRRARQLSNNLCWLIVIKTIVVGLNHFQRSVWCDAMYVYKFMLVMVALWNRADHYIFILFLLSSFFFFFFFFHRLISAVGDWMSTILRHMVWS